MQQADNVYKLPRRRKSAGKVSNLPPQGDVIPFPNQRAYPFGRARPFDPTDPADLEAWQVIWECAARMERAAQAKAERSGS